MPLTNIPPERLQEMLDVLEHRMLDNIQFGTWASPVVAPEDMPQDVRASIGAAYRQLRDPRDPAAVRALFAQYKVRVEPRYQVQVEEAPSSPLERRNKRLVDAHLQLRAIEGELDSNLNNWDRSNAEHLSFLALLAIAKILIIIALEVLAHGEG